MKSNYNADPNCHNKFIQKKIVIFLMLRKESDILNMNKFE